MRAPMRRLQLVLVLPLLFGCPERKTSPPEVHLPDAQGVVAAPTPPPEPPLTGPDVVEVEVDVGEAACSKAECGRENPCCNSCNAALEIQEEGHLRGTILQKNGAVLACSGRSCEFRSKCPLPPGRYRLKGDARSGAYGQRFFAIEAHQLVRAGPPPAPPPRPLPPPPPPPPPRPYDVQAPLKPPER